MVCLTNQRYKALSETFGRNVFATLSVQLDGILAWKWNYEWMIVFQSVILKHNQYVSNTKHICARIQF